MNEKQKIDNNTNILLIITCIVIILLLIACGYLLYDEIKIDNNNSSTNNSIEENNNVVENKENSNENTEKDNIDTTKDIQSTLSKLTSTAYATTDDEYLLILNEYNRNWSNPKFTSPTLTFTLSHDLGQGVDYAYGNYYIDGENLVLVTNDNQLSILNELGNIVSENSGQYRATLNIKDNNIIIGTTTLSIK